MRMGIFSELFKSGDKAQNRTTGATKFFLGCTTSGKAVTDSPCRYSRVRILSKTVTGTKVLIFSVFMLRIHKLMTAAFGNFVLVGIIYNIQRTRRTDRFGSVLRVCLGLLGYKFFVLYF